MGDQETRHLNPSSNRRGFLKRIGFAGAGAAAISLLPRADSPTLASNATNSSNLGRKALVNLNASDSGFSEFSELCESIMDAEASSGRNRNLSSVTVRLISKYQIYLKSVDEARSWLHDNGYLRSLDYYVKQGGRRLILFDELNSMRVPQYFTGRRGLAYLSFALSENYANAGNRLLYTVFPGPAPGLKRSGFYEYFRHYDLMAARRMPRTLGEVFRNDVDPLVRNRTMLRHNGRGVFDSVALSYDPNRTPLTGRLAQTVPYLEWMKADVDNAFWLYQMERSGSGKSQLQTNSQAWDRYWAGKSLAPFDYTSSCSYVHVAEHNS